MITDSAKDDGQVSVDELLPYLRKPSRYIGKELHSVRKDWNRVGLRLVLVFPDLYEVGMSHQGLQILYRAVNSHDGLLAERAFAPDVDLEALLRERGEPLFSLESYHALGEFDVVGITLPYELSCSNILTILYLARIPFRALDRRDPQPLVIGGGSCSLNPEPVADFFDAILLGDGEEAILEIAGEIRAGRERGCGREEILNRLSSISGVYVPSLFQPQYDAHGGMTGIKPLKPGYERVRRRIVADLDRAVTPYPPLVPNSRIVHDRLGVEIARGCTRGCRFCQAGIIYRPVRERSPARILEMARAGIKAGGFDELALLSLSTGDYSCLEQLLSRLIDIFVDRKVSVSMPSMRVGTLTPEIMAQIKRVRKTGFTVAPEAGTDRLRRVINKGITEEGLIATCQAAFSLGWNLLKFYFMIGLPTETAEDIEAIGQLLGKALKTARSPKSSINVSLSIFVPKPHTPFQWEPQISIEEGYARLERLKKSLPRRGVKLKYHDPRQSFLEGVLTRGDRRLAAVIETAWQQGARLDGWAEHFRLDTWLQAGERCGIDLAGYLRERASSEVLPWQHLDSGVDPDFLQAERAKARTGEYTPDCRVHGCQQCGVCDFKKISPVVHGRSRPFFGTETDRAERQAKAAVAGPLRHHLYRLTYSRLGEVRFLGHLELIQVFFRALSRAGADVNFSEGFNPTPRVSFSPALPVGTESMAEFIDIDLATPPKDPAGLLAELNRQLPDGLTINNIYNKTGSKSAAGMITCYTISFDPMLAEKVREKLTRDLEHFRNLDSLVIVTERKGRIQHVDIRQQVREMSVNDEGGIHLVMSSRPGKAGCKPLVLLQTVAGMHMAELLGARVRKLWWREEEES